MVVGRQVALILGLTILAPSAGCTELNDTPQACTVGATQPCVCPEDQSLSSQTCSQTADGGTDWLECLCGTTSDAAADATPDTTPDASPDTGPDTVEDATVDATPDTADADAVAPDATPDAVVDAIPDGAADAAPDAQADATPDAVADAAPDGVADATPDSTGDVSGDPETLWAELLALPGMHWVYRASETYLDLDHTMPVANGDNPLSFKALGNNIPNVSDLDWIPSLDYSAEQVWYSGFGPRPAYVDRGNGDQYIRFVNGLASNYESQPGQLTPWEAAGEDFHLIHCFRAMPGASFEGSIGSLSWKNKAGNGNQITLLYSGETDAVGPDGAIAIWGQDNIVEIKVSATGEVELSLNGDVIIQTTFAGIVTGGIKEFVLGTNSHVMSKHLRGVFMKRGAHFTSDELATIYANTNALWPRGVFPTFPYLDGQYTNVSTSWNGGTKTWAPPTGSFSGGNGEEGDHLYQWYYWRSGDTATFNFNNKLDAHLPIPGATGPTLTRTDYEAGNAAGNPVIFDNPGNGEVSIMRVVTPRDSAGTEGEPLPGQWALDNIP